MKNINVYQGINQFGPAYQIMFENDSHATGSVDRVLMNNMIKLNSETVDFLYSDFTPIENSYEKGSKSYLENLIESMIKQPVSQELLIESIVEFTSQLQEKCTDDLSKFEVGGTEEYIIEHGTDWCTDVARVGCALFQVAGFPARIVYLVNTEKAYSGHVIVEVFRDNVWGAIDTSTNVIYKDSDNKPGSIWDLMKNPHLIDIHSKEDATPYTNDPQFRSAAISNYYIWNWQEYDYTKSKVNDYYRSILEMSDKGWPGGLMWIHGEGC